MIHKSRAIFSTQFHPEAKGGPLDSSYLFDAYLDSVTKYKNSQKIFQPKRDSRPSPLFVDILSKERVGVVPPTGILNMQMASEAAGVVASAAAAAA
jgi:carbamoyl-phosphate synthase small subunit